MPQKKKDGKFQNFYLKKDIVEALDHYSSETGIPKTFVVETALREFLKNHSTHSTKKD